MPENKNIRLEICCGDIGSLYAAAGAGCRRVELCSGLADGGVTPATSLIDAAVALGIESVNVLVRPRGGDFLYEEYEIRTICADIREAVAHGATGIVCGALTQQGDADEAAMRSMIEAAQGRDIIFHRAFDVCRDPESLLETLIEMGVERVLTSGCAPTAAEGIQTLRRMADLSRGRIRIMAGSGVTPANAAGILACGVDAIHSTARSPRPSKMIFRRDDVAMGKPGSDEYSIMQTDPQIVKQLIEITDNEK